MSLVRHLAALILTLACLAPAAASAAEVAVIPQPRSLERGDGSFTITAQTRIVTPPGDAGAAAAGRFLRERLERGAGLKVAMVEGEAVDGAIAIASGGADEAEGAYALDVTPAGVRVRGHDAAGLFYGVQTLLQLLPPQVYGDKPATDEIAWAAPSVSVRDRPRFGWRGGMLDVCRHIFKKQEIFRLLDAMAMQKQNVFHWHLTDDQGWRIEIKRYPKLTEVGAWRKSIGFGLDPKASDAYDAQGRYGGFFTQDDVREVVAYAAARHITVVPEIEMPGHATAALATFPNLSCTGGPFEVPEGAGVFEEVFCAGNEETFAFLEGVLEEVIPLFPSTYVHVGGDECPKTRWKACPKCQSRIKAEGLKDEHELQSYFIRRMEKFLNARGKRLIGWDEILEGGLAPNATVMSWRGIKGGIAAAQSGHDTVMSPTSHVYLDYRQAAVGEPNPVGPLLPLEKVYGYEPIPAELTPEQAKHVKGVQGNLWTEFVPNFDHAMYQMFPRLSAIAEVGWSERGQRDFADFQRRVEVNQRRLDAIGLKYRPVPPAGIDQAIRVDDEGKRVTIDSPLPGVAARYTVDGAEPTPDSPAFDQPIDLPAGRAVRVRARFFTPGNARGFYVERSFLNGVPFELSTNLRAYQDNEPMRALDGRDETFFWGDRAVRAGDHVTIRFATPRPLTSVRIVTGKEGGRTRDALISGVLETSTDGKQFVVAGTFVDGAVEATLDGAPVLAVRLRATEAAETWLAVREITLR